MGTDRRSIHHGIRLTGITMDLATCSWTCSRLRSSNLVFDELLAVFTRNGRLDCRGSFLGGNRFRMGHIPTERLGRSRQYSNPRRHGSFRLVCFGEVEAEIVIRQEHIARTSSVRNRGIHQTVLVIQRIVPVEKSRSATSRRLS